MSLHMEEVLRKLGWDSGFHLPVANNENQALQHEVERLMLQKARASGAFDNATLRFSSLTQHLQFVRQQNEENQNLLTTYKQQFESEQNKFQVALSEKTRVLQESRQIDKNVQEIKSRIDIRKLDLTKGVTKIEKLKSESTWDAEALKAWEESLKKRDEDNELLKQFSKEDERRANDLEAKRKNLQMEVVGRKEMITKMFGELTNYEQIVNRLDKVRQEQQAERESLLQQWQGAVATLSRRNTETFRTNQELSITQEVILKQQEILDEQNNFLNNEKNNNAEIENEIEAANLTNSKLRRDLNDLVQYVLTLHSEADTLKRNLVSTASYLEKERAKGRNLNKEINFKEHRIKLLEKDVTNLRIKLDDVKNTSMSASDRAKQLEQIIQYEQRQCKILSHDIEKVQSLLFRSQQAIQGLKNNAKTVDTEISGSERGIVLLRRLVKKTYNELQRQKEISYDLDYQMNELESRLVKLEGEQTNDEDSQAQNAKIAQLEKVFAEHNEIKSLLQSQVIHVENEMRRLSNAITADKIQVETLQAKLQEQILLFEGGQKHNLAAKINSQEKQVEENVLRLRVNQLEKAMAHENNSLFSLQKHRLELETAMRERQIEINTNKEVLLVQRRNLNEEKGRLKCDIMGRRNKIDQLQKRYHIALMALGKGEDGEPLSATYFKIKNAQEKYMLQQHGDELDSKIRRAEKEIVAMENTLKVVNLANSTYKQSLSAIDEDGEEIREKSHLENEINKYTVSLRNTKRVLTKLKENLQDMNTSLQTVDNARQEAIGLLETTENQYADHQRYHTEQLKKLYRAEKHLSSLMKNINNVNVEKYDKDLLIRQLKDANKSALQQLAEVSTRYQEITPLIGRYISQHNLALPGSRVRLTPSTSSDSSRSTSSNVSTPSISKVVLTLDLDASSSRQRSSSTKNGKHK